MSGPSRELRALADDLDVALAFTADKGWHLAPDARMAQAFEPPPVTRVVRMVEPLSSGRLQQQLDRFNRRWKQEQGYGEAS